MFTVTEGFKTREKDFINPNVWQMVCCVCFLLGLFFHYEEGGDMILRNVG
jgi:hypothetical protein